jgi:hypothetical protein
MPPPLAPGRKTRTSVPQNSASHESQNRPSNADGDATGQLDILDADDILESDDISALEAAAAGITSFEVAPSDPSGFEVGEIGDLEDAEVEGEIEAPPPSLSTLFGMKPKAAPPIKAAPIPAAPVTSPLPLESVVVAAPVAVAAAVAAPEPEIEPAPISRSEPAAERTLELKRVDLALAATQLEAQDQENAGHTEVLVRSAMPSAIRTMHGGVQAPAPTPPVPSVTMATRRPSSIAPVAVDVGAARPAMQSVPAFPPPARMPSYASMTPKRGLSGLAIGVIAFSALALVGLVGIGGYAASRALTEQPVAAASAPEAPAAAGVAAEGEPSSAVVAPSPVTAPAPSAPEPPNASPSSVGTGSAIDVSALPTAAPAAAAPRIATGRTSAVSAPAAPAAAPLAAAGPLAPAGAPAGKGGGALPPPGGGKVASSPLAPPGAPLPPPPAPAAAAPAAAAPVSATGTVRVDPNLRAVQVDGAFRRANDGVVVVTCGTHRIKAGMKGEQTVNVPCGGSVSL